MYPLEIRPSNFFVELDLPYLRLENRQVMKGKITGALLSIINELERESLL